MKEAAASKAPETQQKKNERTNKNDVEKSSSKIIEAKSMEKGAKK